MNIVNVGYDSTNYYVVDQNRQRLLIDVGWPGSLPKLRASLKRKSMALEDLGYLCVTHYHPDHAGLVQELKDQGVKHIVLEQQLSAIPRLKTYLKPDSGYVDIRIQDSIHLVTAESRAWLASIGLSGEMVSTPGHSDDSISLVLDEGIAFTGDLLPPAMVDADKAEVAKQSWARLRALNVRTIYPGHGPTRPMP
jgi:glyoxylase-like metal-dependent hydrolase (beta-lactamase superfamily II)